MIDEQDAVKKVLDFIKRHEFGAGAELVIMAEETISKPYGWVYVYTSKQWLETGRLEHAIGGNGPLVVLRETGEVIALGTADNVEVEVQKFERARGLTNESDPHE